MTPKEIYHKSSISISDIQIAGSPKEIFKRSIDQNTTNELRWYKDRVRDLEFDLSNLTVILHDKEREAEEREEFIDRLETELENLRYQFE